MLLVDHHDAEGPEGDAALDQGMGADDDVGPAVGQRRQDPLALLGAGAAGEQLDGERSLVEEHPRALLGRDGEPLEDPSDADAVLLGQHLGGRHQRRLMAALHGRQHGGDGHRGLADADVALEQPVHRVRAGQVGLDVADGGDLALGQLEGQAGDEPVDERPVEHVPDASGRLLVGLLAKHEGQLDPQQLVEDQARSGDRMLVHRLGPVDPPESGGAVDEVEPVEHLVGHGIVEVDGAPQRLGNPAPEVLAVEPELVGLRVDGGDLEPVGLVEQVDLGVGQLLLAPEGGDLPEEHRLRPLGQLPGAPWLVEEGDHEGARAVGDPELGAGLAPPAAGDRARRHHPSEDPCVLVHPQVADRRLLGLVEIAPRIVGQDVEHRVHVELGQRLGPLRTDAVQDGDRELVERSERLRHGLARRPYSMPNR